MTNKPSKPERPARLWQNVGFTLMWTSTAASGFGDRMIMLAALALLGGLAADAHNSTAIQASTQFFFFAPYIVMSMVGGWLADRLPRKWLLLSCDECRGVTMLLGVFLLVRASGAAAIATDHHWEVFLCLALIGCFAAIFNPTRNAIVPQIVTRPQLQSANAVILVINVVASMIGMLVGGAIISPDSASSVQHGLLFGAMFYLVSGTFFAFLKPRRHMRRGAVETARTAEVTDASETAQTSEPGETTRTDDPTQTGEPSLAVEAAKTPQAQPPAAAGSPKQLFAQTARYALNHKRVLVLVGLSGLVWASAAVASSGVLGVAKMHYGLQGNALLEMFSRVYAVLGAGLLVGAATVMAVQSRRESTLLTMSGIGLAGLGVLAMAAVPLVWVTYAAAFIVGLFGNLAIVTIVTMIQSISPNYIRGRIMGLAALASTVASVSSYFVIWRLPNSDQNILYAMFGLGPILMIVGGLGLWRHMRHGGLDDWPADAFYRLTRLFAFSWHRLEMHGRQNVPFTGPVILASNHTTGLDPFLIQAACRRKIRWLMTESYRFKLLNVLWNAIEPICLEADSTNMTQMRQIIRVLREQQAIVGFFPEGGVQRKHRELQPFQPGFGLITRRSRATIVPVWIEGTPRQTNMLWQLLQPSHSRVRFGKPYQADPNADDQTVVDDLRRRILEVKGE